MVIKLLQNQFLDLKTNNYSLEDGIKRKDNEITQLRTRNEELERELTKLKNFVKFNPFAKKEMKDKDFIDNLQRKMDNQEDEFKRTNETLRMEIGSLIKTTERLKDKLIEVGIEDFEFEDVNCYETSTSDTGDNSNESREGDLGAPSDNGQVKNGGLNSSPMRFAILKEKELLENKVLDLESKFKTEVKLNEQLSNKLEDTNLILESTKKQLMESESLANQRKSLIDEMKEHIENITIKNADELIKIKSSMESIESQLKSANQDKEQLNQQIGELIKSVDEKESLIKKLINEKEELISSNEEVKKDLIKIQAYCESRVKEVEMEKERAMILITETTSSETSEMKEKLISKDNELLLIKKELESMTRKVDDSVEERRIHEKKGLMMVKELKKQIQHEKSRADKLQEKLNQFLSESSNVHELDTNCRHGNSNCGQVNCDSNGSRLTANPSDCGHNQNNDTSSSIGSWSFMPGVAKRGHRRNSSLQSGQSLPISDGGCPQSGSPSAIDAAELSTCSNVSILESENTTLVSKMAAMQEEKWTLEEKLNQLQKMIDKLSSENESKSAIIKFYCMDGRSDNLSSRTSSGSKSSRTTDKMTVRRVVDFIHNKGDENLKEINRKLQRILEETLIKNMHLHQDLERLSDQLVRQQSTDSSVDSSLTSSTSTITSSATGSTIYRS